MKKLSMSVLGLLLGLTMIVPQVFALEILSSDELLIPADKVYEDNLILAGGMLTVEGTIKGDLILAGGYVTLKGIVDGDVVAAGGRLDIPAEGVITGDVKMLGGSVIVNGKIQGNGTFYVGQIDLNGEVGSLSLDAGQVNLNGTINEGAKIRAGMLRFGSKTLIKGDLNYASPNEVVFAEGSVVQGQKVVAEYYPEDKLNKLQNKQGWLDQSQDFWKKQNISGWVISYLMLLLIGLIGLAVFPKYASTVTKAWEKSFWANLGLGLVFAVALPIAFLILLFTVVGIPLGLLLVLLSIFAAYLAPLIPSYWAGANLLKFEDKNGATKLSKRFWVLALGLLCYKVLMLIPIISGFLYVVLVLSALGAMLLTRKAAVSRKS